jgi:DNA modification methylase
MKIKHKIIFNNSKNMKVIPSNSVDLVVTSPPYPMIKMWDDMFCSQNSSIKDALNKFSGKGDTVLDPFLGTGTTMAAAMASARNSIGYEIDQSICPKPNKKTY